MDVSAFFDSYFTISDIFAERQEGPNNALFERKTPRPTDALLLFTDSTAIYEQKNGKKLYVPHGALVYIPRGCVYKIENHSVGGKNRVKVMLFEFTLYKTAVSRKEKNITLSSPASTPMSFGTDNICVVDFRPKLYERLFSSLIDMYNSKDVPPVSLYQAAYAIFECLIKNKYPHAVSEDKSIIETSIQYLSRIDKPEKSITEIADLCCVSVSCLEKQFKKYMEMTPLEYRLECKIIQAKNLLAQSKLSVPKIAEELNLCDSPYLYKIFKNKVGMTPGEYRRRARMQENIEAAEKKE